MTILVTGATGQIGGETARALVAGGERVRALVRDPAAAQCVDGAEPAQGSFEDEASLDAAMRGVAVVLLAGRDNPGQVAQHANVLRAAERAGVGHVVKLSAIGASTASPIELMRHHAELEERVRGGRMRWTLARPHLFMQNLLRSAAAVRDRGRLSAPLGAMRVPLVDTRDVAAALAAILASPDGHAGATYALTGPAALGYAEVAAAWARLSGREVAYEALAPERYERDLVAAGAPGWRAHDLAHIASAYSAADCAVTPDLETLLGRPPRSLEDFLSDHREAFAPGGS